MAPKSFEQSMKQLEQIVEQLETGELPLEKALKKFEDGMKLSRSCSAMLDETERKINLLIEDRNGTISEQPLESEPDDLEIDT